MSTQNPIPILLLSALLLAPCAAPADPPESPHHEPKDDGATPRLELRRDSGQEPPDRRSMAAWHRRYRPLAAPVKEALAELLAARQTYRPYQWEPECRGLDRAVKTFRHKAREEKVFPVASAAADVALKRLYGQLGKAATACLAGRWGAMDGHLYRVGRHYRQAKLVLRSYGLEP